MADVMLDRRVTPRYPLILVAEVTDSHGGAKRNARTSDVSRSGCYIDTLHPAPAGTQIRVRLTNRSESFESECNVAYISPGLGMGVAFVEPIPASRLAILDRWLEEAARTTR